MLHKILHVDDDPAVLRLIGRQLAKQGYDIQSLCDPREVIPVLLNTGCRIVIVDVDMPHIDGLTLLRTIKEHDGGIQVVLLTGMVSMSVVMQAMMVGAEACLFKPLADITHLTSVLDAAVVKMERWRETLYDRTRRHHEELAATVQLA